MSLSRYLIPPGDPPHPSEETRLQGGEVSNSLPEAAWREGIARKALETESPIAIPPKASLRPARDPDENSKRRRKATGDGRNGEGKPTSGTISNSQK